MDIDEWAKREEEAKRIGLDVSIQKSLSSLVGMNMTQRAREALWISRLHKLDKNPLDALFFLLLSFLNDGDQRTLFATCRLLFNEYQTELCNVCCDLYLAKFENENLLGLRDMVKLLKYLCLDEMDEISAHLETLPHLAPDTSLWLRGRMFTSKDIRSLPD